MTVVKIDEETINLWNRQGLEFGWDSDGVELAIDAVNKGAGYLDKENPGWVSKVVPEKLGMASSSFCIIGQVYGNYDEYIGVVFGYDKYETEESYEKAIEHGFMIRGDEPYPFGLLDRVWVYMLAERNERGAPVSLSLL